MSFQQIVILLTACKYFFLFPIMVVEGPIITVIAGFLSSLGLLNVFITYVVVVIGDLAGDSIAYAVGRWGGNRLIKRWGHYVWLNIERIEKFQDYFHTHAAKAIIGGKLAYGLEVPFLIGAGLAKVPYRKFFLYTLIPTLPKSLLFLLIGFYFGEAYNKINAYLGYAAIGAMGIATMLIIVYFTVRKISKNYKYKNIDQNKAP